jgi:3'-phosphoadenosine 5'-phosphosulfate sulfotransferase (PAPS reductase)/FAD synthetase
MLYHILEAFGGTLPDDVKVMFQNTGKERPETLDFVERCSQRWGVPVIWTEYRHRGGGKHGWRVVDYSTASRGGEPFAAILEHHREYRAAKGLPPVLPNPVQRFCTSELKMRTMRRYCVEKLGWSHWTNCVGIRADEPRRVARLGAQRERWDNVAPLAKAGVTEPDVMAFWSAQPFDLALQQHEGNCDLCFLKNTGKILSILKDRPNLGRWWADLEASTGQRFRKDRPAVADLMAMAGRPEPLTLFDAQEPDDLPCHCTD